MFDELVTECSRSSEWPANLSNSQHLPSALFAAKDVLLTHRDRLFVSETKNASVKIMEVLTGETREYNST